MDKIDLSAIIGDVDLLINAYEAGTTKQIGKSPASTVETYALSLHVSPIMQGLFTLNVIDSASMTQEEIFNEHNKHVAEAEFNKTEYEKKEKELEKQFYFDFECETVDPESEYYSLIKPNYGKDTTLKGPVISDPFKINIESNLLKDLNNYYANNFDLNKSAEDCFNCDLSFKLETTYPGIEFAWEFGKILEQLKEFLDLIKQNLDPTGIYNQLCNFKMFVGKNFMCPSNMLNLNLMLPALFMKYSIDLAKLSLDLNWILGGIIKAIFATIAAFLENIRSLIMPFINCYIDGVNTTFGYIKSVIKAIGKVVDDTLDTLERTVGAIMKSVAQITDLFTTSKAEELDKKIKEQEEKLKKAISKFNAYKEEAQERTKIIDRINKNIQLVQNKLSLLKKAISQREVINYILSNEKKYLSNGEEVLNYSSFREAFLDYFKNNNIQISDDLNVNTAYSVVNYLFWNEKIEKEKQDESKYYKGYLEKTKTDMEKSIREVYDSDYNIQKIEKEKQKLIKDSLFERVSVEPNTFVNSATGFIEKRTGSSLNDIYTPRYKTGSLLHSAGTSFNKFANGHWEKIENFLTTRYGVKASNAYMKTEYFNTARNKVKQVEKTSLDTIEGVRKLLVRPAEDLKAFINDFIGNVLNALQSLALLFDQGAMAQLKLLGELLQLTHLVRLIRLIIKLVQEGFSGCEELPGNKDKQQKLKEIIEEINPNLSLELFDDSDGSINENESFKTDKQIGRIYAKRSNYSHLLNIKDCGELSKHMEKENVDLDDLYKNLKEALV